jgi:hypothetical protein
MGKIRFYMDNSKKLRIFHNQYNLKLLFARFFAVNNFFLKTWAGKFQYIHVKFFSYFREAIYKTSCCWFLTLLLNILKQFGARKLSEIFYVDNFRLIMKIANLYFQPCMLLLGGISQLRRYPDDVWIKQTRNA